MKRGWLLLLCVPLIGSSLPVVFEPNQGQTAAQVKFLARAPGYVLFVTAEEAVFKGQDGAVERMKFIGANRATRVEPLDRLPGASNYFLGKHPDQWRTNVPHYARFALREVYPGIDLVFYGKDGQLEYDWIVAPGADPRRIRVRWEAPGKISQSSEGDLILGASLRAGKPAISQNGKPIEGGYALRGNQVRFEIARYDAAQPLVIDPMMLIYSTYLGGRAYNPANMGDTVWSTAVDGSGNAYVTGSTASTDFPLTGALQTNYEGDVDAFVTKISTGGSMIVYSTYLGGSSTDIAYGIAVDASGNAYVAGKTLSDNFPPVHAFQPNNASVAANAFVVKINAAGSALTYSTYLGGSSTIGDWAQAIAVDGAGSAYLTGYAYSKDFPTVNPIQKTQMNSRGSDAFVTKFSPSGSALVYSTYLGGSGNLVQLDYGAGIAVDSSGNAYVTGVTGSTDFPTVNPAQASLGSNSGNAFVTKVNPAGTAFVYSTYLGGNFEDQAFGIALDSGGNAYVAGETESKDFPTTPNSYQPARPFTGSGFVTKFTPAGAFSYSTFLGGSQGASGISAIAVDSTGDAYVTGVTVASDFPLLSPLQTTGNLFVTKFNAAGSGLIYSTEIGGATANTTSSTSIAVDPFGNAYVGAVGYSEDFPMVNAIQPTNYRGTLGTGVVFAVAAYPAALTPPAGLMINSANKQTAPAGTQLPQALSVLVTGGSATPLPGVTVNFAIASGSGTLSAPGALTDSNGTAGVALTLGFSVGTVTVTASITGSALTPVTFTETVTSNPTCPIAPPVIGSVNSATDFGGLSNFAAGSYLEVKGSNLAIDMRQWAGSDFNGGNAPTMLDGTRVSIDSLPGYVSYISSGQVNVQAPADTATGMVPVTVTNCAGSSNTVMFQKNALSPGMLAPASFNVGKPYLVALFAADLNQGVVTYVGNPGLIAGANFRPASPGDVIIVYGLGFGAVTPATPPGVIATGSTSLSGLSVNFGQTPATLTYQGLYPGYVGLYEFYVTVPTLPAGDVPVNLSIDGTAVPQTLFLTVQ